MSRSRRRSQRGVAPQDLRCRLRVRLRAPSHRAIVGARPSRESHAWPADVAHKRASTRALPQRIFGHNLSHRKCWIFRAQMSPSVHSMDVSTVRESTISQGTVCTGCTNPYKNPFSEAAADTIGSPIRRAFAWRFDQRVRAHGVTGSGSPARQRCCASGITPLCDSSMPPRARPTARAAGARHWS